MAGGKTPATAALIRAGVAFTLHPYETAPDHGPADHRGYGAEAAIALGVDPYRIFKTLLAESGDRPVLAVVPVARQLDLKALAAARQVKRAVLADPRDAERITGSVVGGISPLGSRRPLPVIVDASAADLPTMYVSAGRRGLQLELEPADLIAATRGRYAAITGDG